VGEVVSQQDLVLRCRDRRKSGEKIVFLAGLFDFLHPGHIRLLEQARDYGEVLVAGVWSDPGGTSVVERAKEREIETPPGALERAFTPAAERAEILAALAAVDYAVEVAPDELPSLLAGVRPEIVIEGGKESPLTPLARASIAARVRLVRIPLEPGHSTAGIIERIVQLSGSE
jgi:D-glycero-beta-D-manno-heptose 1-phosphate adenylyltransferase